MSVFAQWTVPFPLRLQYVRNVNADADLLQPAEQLSSQTPDLQHGPVFTLEGFYSQVTC